MDKGTLGIAIIWHMHQPYYGIGEGGPLQMPWVRLHGTKDYLDMAIILAQHPGAKATFNFVPSLLKQIGSYVEGARDYHLDLCLQDPKDLTEDEKESLLHILFQVHPLAVRRFPRYQELYRRWQEWKGGGGGRKGPFQNDQLSDLQVLFNLAWFDPTHFSDPALRALKDKGKGFRQEDKNRLRDKTYEILSSIIPMYRRLALEGKIELTASPFYHPILPLLIDTDVAREAYPETPLPASSFRSPEDAETQIARAIEYHAEIFGSQPTGMWPSEGSVSHALSHILIRKGIHWIATDEAILFRSTGKAGIDLSNRESSPPPDLYRPHIVEDEVGRLAIFFRDRFLSDQISFLYYRKDVREAIDHMKSYLMNVRESALRSGNDHPVLTVVVDGENPWENYANDGNDFLHALYRLIEENPRFAAITPTDYLAHVRESGRELPRIDRLAAGSWIGGNFRIWIGHAEKNTAWDLLRETRQHLISRGDHADPERLKQAWEEILIAEGSDWFWWYGDDFSSDMDAEFDRIFRVHLIRVYEILGDDPPEHLYRAISAASHAARFTADRSELLSIQLDGRISSFYEWRHARHYSARFHRPPHRDSDAIETVFWGCSEQGLALRFDFKKDTKFPPQQQIILTVLNPKRMDIAIPLAEGLHPVVWDGKTIGSCYRGQILETSIAMESLCPDSSHREVAFLVREPLEGVLPITYPVGELFRIKS